MSGNSEAVWGLMPDGEIYIRTEITPHCQQGLKWTKLDLAQLGKYHTSYGPFCLAQSISALVYSP